MFSTCEVGILIQWISKKTTNNSDEYRIIYLEATAFKTQGMQNNNVTDQKEKTI